MPEETGPGIKLHLYCDQADENTKAGVNGEKPGVKELNENYLKTVDLFFYPGNNPSRTDEAVLHRRFTPGSRNGQADFWIQLTTGDVNGGIFPENERYVTVFVLVNYPGESFTGTSLSALESQAITTDFLNAKNNVLETFLMSGKEVLTLNDRTQILTASGNILLKRYACKMTVNVRVNEYVETEKSGSPGIMERWEPILEDLAVYLDNAVQTVTLSGEKSNPQEADYFSYTDNKRKYVKKNLDGTYSALYGKEGDFYTSAPMYMYPQHWHFASADGPDREPFVKVVLPWHRKADPDNGISATSRQFYYKIVLPTSITETDDEGWDGSFVRNNWYHLNLDVSYLGSDNDGAAVPVDGTCYIVYWQDKNVVIKKAKIGNARYLSVDKNEYILHDVDDAHINYVSSHEVVVKPNSLRVTRPYYGDKDLGYQKDLGATIKEAGVNEPFYDSGQKYLEFTYNNYDDILPLDASGSYINFHHLLEDRYTEVKFDYSPYRISFTLVHDDKQNASDERTYSQDIVIWQYPGVYIEARENSDDSFIRRDDIPDRNKKKIYESTYWGYVFVDNQQMVRAELEQEYNLHYWAQYYRDRGYDFGDDEDFHWRCVWYTGGSRDIFNMNVTVLPQNADFVIGDPRTKEIDNLSPKQFHEAPALDGTTRSLMYYHPADGDDRTINMMAPSYRIASKCGGVEFGGVTLEQAKYRCASYQEDGFPAGRWRLPTRGEIRFIAMLSANKAFTYLFSDGSAYWSANGMIKVSGNDVVDANDGVALPRCVYDSWYWDPEDKEELNEFLEAHKQSFVWGDME